MSNKIQKRFSSVRCVPPQTTLSRAKAWASIARISQVTDITHLDRLGLPVFVSMRSQAQGSAATYGKGLVPIDAEVGAYMEAIEYYFAEPTNSYVATQWGTAKDVAGADLREDAILDFPPVFQKSVALDAPLLLAVAHDVETARECLVPAELVYYPAPNVGQSLFGSSTNGLASGNSVLEATIHGLAEVIERDIWSFEFIKDSSFLLNPQSLPANVGNIVEQATKEGLKLVIRYVPNDYGLAFFCAYLFDPNNLSPKLFNGGWGCHPHREIALVRAVCEAAQSRLAFIHGSRTFVKPAKIPKDPHQQEDFLRQATHKVANQAKIVSYTDIPDLDTITSIEELWQVLLNCLRQVTDMPVYRVVYTPPEAPLQVVRIIVPTLEDFKEATMRTGRRFKTAIDSMG